MPTKTADYTRRAIDKYQTRYDYVSVRFEKGIKERLKAALQGQSISGFISDLVLAELERMEQEQSK